MGARSVVNNTKKLTETEKNAIVAKKCTNAAAAFKKELNENLE